jgi:hypothetical protein
MKQSSSVQILCLITFSFLLSPASKAGIYNPDGSLNAETRKTIVVGESLELDGVGGCIGSKLKVTNINGTRASLSESLVGTVLNGCTGKIVSVANRKDKKLEVVLGGLSDLDALVSPALQNASLSIQLDDYLLGGNVFLHLYGNGSAGTGTLIEYFSPSTMGMSVSFARYDNSIGWNVDQTFDLGPSAGYDESDFGWSTYGVLKSLKSVPGPVPLLGVCTALGYTRKIRSRIQKSRTQGGVS